MSTTSLCKTKGWICIFCNAVHLILPPSPKKDSILRKVFRALSAIFSSKSVQPPSALHALRFVIGMDDTAISKLFGTIMASNDLTDQHWEAARLIARHLAWGPDTPISKEILLKFLDYNLGLQGAGEDHGPSITLAFKAVMGPSNGWVYPPPIECIRNFNCASSPSFVRGIRLIMRPDDPLGLQMEAIHLISLTPDQWFDSPIPVMEPEEMSEFCEHLAVFMVDGGPHGMEVRKSSITILFGMLRSPEWRKHIVTRLWRVFAHCGLVEEEQESFRWCLRNAIKLLEFTRQLPDGEGLKWWFVTLWFHYNKLDITVRDEAEKIARDVLPSDGSLSRDSYLDLIRREVGGTRDGSNHR